MKYNKLKWQSIPISVLGPVLFTVYFIDLVNRLTNARFKLADVKIIVSWDMDEVAK